MKKETLILRRNNMAKVWQLEGEQLIPIFDRDERRKCIIHAEENVLSEIKRGEAKIMAVTGLPCEICIKSAAKKGVNKIIYAKALEGYNHELTFQLAKEFGIELIQFPISGSS